MTNYNERLDELITSCDFEPEAPHSRICKWCGEAKGTSIHTTRQALTSLMKELVAEAKPEIKAHPLGPVTLADCQRGLDHYEANLLKALEEV